MQIDQEDEGKPFQMPVGIPHTPVTPDAPGNEEQGGGTVSGGGESSERTTDQESRLSGETEVGRPSMEGTEGSETVRGSTDGGRVET